MADNSEEMVHKIWEGIRMKHDGDALGMAKAITYAAEKAITVSVAERKEYGEYIHSMQRMLTGNGDVETGLLSRLSKLERQMSSNCEQMRILTNAIIGTVDKRGVVIDLQLRMEKVEKSIENLNKITWMVITVVIGQIVLRLIDLF